ncbi:MAG: foldase protein PrsA, partial [Actinomycetota bacterium]|nr:foldase protein PrsA [Actinomycetota bacterium]
ISHDIITAEAEAADIEVTDDEVQEQIDVIKQQFENEEAFQQALADQALEESQLPDLVKDQVLEMKLREQVVENISVSPAEVRSFYDENIGDYQQSRVSHILVKQKDEALADRLAARLQSTPTGQRKALFAALAKQHSTDPTTGPKGGDLGLAPSSKYVPTFAAAIDALEVNEVSDPVSTQFGWHVIFVTKRVTASYPEVRASIEQQLEGPMADKAWTDWLREAYEDADVKVNPRYGELDIESRRVVDTEPQDVPGSDVEPTPSASISPQPEESPEA